MDDSPLVVQKLAAPCTRGTNTLRVSEAGLVLWSLHVGRQSWAPYGGPVSHLTERMNFPLGSYVAHIAGIPSQYSGALGQPHRAHSVFKR
jgi:hypothetical protein